MYFGTHEPIIFPESSPEHEFMGVTRGLETNPSDTTMFASQHTSHHRTPIVSMDEAGHAYPHTTPNVLRHKSKRFFCECKATHNFYHTNV